MSTLYYQILKMFKNDTSKIWNDRDTLKLEYDEQIVSFLNKKKTSFVSTIECNGFKNLMHTICIRGAYTPFYVDRWNKINKRRQEDFKNKYKDKYKNKDTNKYDIFILECTNSLIENVLENEYYSIIYELYQSDKKNDCFIDGIYAIVNKHSLYSESYVINEIDCMDYILK